MIKMTSMKLKNKHILSYISVHMVNFYPALMFVAFFSDFYFNVSNT